MTTALVTGATAGIGLAFVRRLAADGHDLVLVARDQQRLDDVATELRTAYGREVETLSADLTDRADLQRVADRLADASRPVDVLVNNAGIGLGRGFLSTDVADEERLLDIHCRAVLVLTHAAARAMRERRRGTIINVSSVAGFAAMGTYSAVKAWATTFSEAVATQLAPHGVQVTAVCPGFVHTEFHGRGGMDMSALPEWGWLDADDLVAEALADVARGKVVSVPSRRFGALVVLLRHLPRAVVRKGSGAVQRRRTQG
ncbi:MAG: SDR family NAD(P)-dependent oxidoreductase [Angustibacter sp.]